MTVMANDVLPKNSIYRFYCVHILHTYCLFVHPIIGGGGARYAVSFLKPILGLPPMPHPIKLTIFCVNLTTEIRYLLRPECYVQ
jgi:hypothetical protein